MYLTTHFKNHKLIMLRWLSKQGSIVQRMLGANLQVYRGLECLSNLTLFLLPEFSFPLWVCFERAIKIHTYLHIDNCSVLWFVSKKYILGQRRYITQSGHRIVTETRSYSIST